MHTLLQKKYLAAAISAFVGALSLLSGLAYAQTECTVEAVPAVTREERQIERAATIEERQEVRQEDRGARRLLLTEQLQTRFLNLFDNAMKRSETALGRLNNISDRLETRLEKLSDAGIDVSAPTATLAAARAKIETVESLIAQARATGEAALTSETPREEFQAARAEFQLATAGLREAFQLLRQVVAEMKDAVRSLEATSGVSQAVSIVPEKVRAP